MQVKQNSGFTIIELMIVLVIIAILVGIAIPSFGSLIKKNNVEALQSKLSAAVGTARAEAASRNVTVSICKAASLTACATPASDDWSAGWIVFTDKNGDGLVTASIDEVIDVYLNTHVNYRVLVSAAIARLSFSSQGFLTGGGAPTTFKVCEPENDVSYARALYVATSGLVMKAGDPDGNGTHNDPNDPDDTSASDLTCPAP